MWVNEEKREGKERRERKTESLGQESVPVGEIIPKLDKD